MKIPDYYETVKKKVSHRGMFYLIKPAKSLIAQANKKDLTASFLPFNFSDKPQSCVIFWRQLLSFFKTIAAHTARNFPTKIKTVFHRWNLTEVISVTQLLLCWDILSGFKYMISAASRIATKVTQTVHEIAQFFSQLWKLQDTFPTSFVFHVSPSSCNIQSPQKALWSLSCLLRCPPRFSWQGCDLVLLWDSASVTEVPQGDHGDVLHQRQQNCLKLNHCTQLGSQS